MIKLTRQELKWCIDLLHREHELVTLQMAESPEGLPRRLFQLRADNMRTTAAKLQMALDTGAQRIAIE